MASLPILDRTGKQVGTYEIDPTALAATINKQLLHDVVVMYQANLRQGTFRSKSRGEVAGTTKKMYRQKGTGHARAGSRRAVQRRGGGHAFAKRPREFRFSIPRKAVQLATRMAIASKITDNQVVVIDELSFATPKTKEFAGILKALKISGSVLVTTAALDVNTYKAARNIEGVTVAPASELTALNVLAPRHLLVTKAALDGIKERAKPKADAAK
jgi:large subunit ribosomal protein L4